MADLAIGISKTAVEALVNKVNTAIKEEAELWQIVQHDTVFMKDEFDMMQSFLKTADWEQVKNTVGRTWVKQVRELSYDAEDSIESIVLLDTKRSFWTFCRRLLASFNCDSGALSPLEQAVDEIKLLKARVEEVSSRNMRYNLIDDSGSKLILPQKMVSAPAVMGTSAAVDILTEAWSTEQKLGGSVNLSMLINESCDSLRIITLWGTRGDLGVTSLIKEAFEEEVVRQKFKSRAWLKLAHPFTPNQFIKRLAEQFYVNSCKVVGESITEVAKHKDLVKEFVQHNKHRYLVIIEDLSNMSDWQAVRTCLPDKESVAKYCTERDDSVYRVKALAADDAIKLFEKRCILYESVFSEVKRIGMRPSHFVRRWIAEGYSKCTNSKTVEEYASDLFSELTKETASMGEWRANSFFHEYINSRLMEERAVFFPLVVSILDKSRSLVTTEGLGQHLVISSTWKRSEEFVFEDVDFSHLQSLTVYGVWKSFFIPYKMKSLRVLDLEGTSNICDHELQRMLELLPRLRFLSLRGHREITCLPDSLSGLRHLQTLDIRRTSIVYVELQKLQKLQCIRAGTSLRWMDDRDLPAKEELTPSSFSSGTLAYCLCKFLGCRPDGIGNGIKVPAGIRHLKALSTLGVVNVNTAKGKDILADIRQLKQLKKLELSGIKRKNSKYLSKAVINQTNLESLSLQVVKENRSVRWDGISLPSSIRSLKLYGHLDMLSAMRFNKLRNLRKLSLEMTKLLTEKDLQILGSVQSLITLRLRVDNTQDGKLQFPPHLPANEDQSHGQNQQAPASPPVNNHQADGEHQAPDHLPVNHQADGQQQVPGRLFSKLQVLELVCLSKLQVIFDQGAMEKLEVIKAHCCSDSSLEVTGLEHPVSLKQVCLQGSYGDTLKKTLQEQLASHPKKPALKLQMKTQSPSSQASRQ
nr:unnamed protein product [Digitaria exilis]